MPTQESLDNSNVPALIHQLCSYLSNDLNEISVIKRQKIVKKLKALAFQKLLKNGVPSSFNKDNISMDKEKLIATLVDRILFNEMLTSTWNNKKNEQLENIIETLSDKMEENNSLANVILFLLSMSQFPLNQDVENNELGIPIKGQMTPINNNSLFYNNARNNYKTSHTKSKLYSEYIPPTLYDNKLMNSTLSANSYGNKTKGIKEFHFEAKPGSGGQLFEKYNTFYNCKYNNNRSFCGVKNRSKLKSFSIPELKLDIPRSLTIPSLKSLHCDEGYVTPEIELFDAGSNGKSSNNSINYDIWRNLSAKVLSEPLRYTWENLGKVEVKKEPPFLLQSDFNIIESWKMHNHILYDAVQPDEFTGHIVTMSHKEFFRDLKCLLIGINTRTFQFDKFSKTFVIRPEVCLPGLTPEGTKTYSKDFIECGNYYRSLYCLIKGNSSVIFSTSGVEESSADGVTRLSDISMRKGLVFEAMCTSINSWMQAYRGVVIKMVDLNSSSLQDLKLWLQPLYQQLQFLVNLFCPATPEFEFPTGGALLTYIYKVVQVTISQPFNYILYHILENCLRVYFRFLENWLFEGLCDDMYGEFFIEQKSFYETSKDRTYWRKSFCLKPERVPTFLTGLVNDIFVCGKTLNLVKLCNPSDLFCQRLDGVLPRIKPCFEENSLNILCEDFDKYVISCENIYGQDTWYNKIFSPWGEMDLDKETFLEMASQKRAKSLLDIQKSREDKLKLENDKKRQLFKQQKDDMLEAKLRKVEERQRELEEDQKLIAAAVKAEKEQDRRKEEEKQTLIRYYKSLEEAADIRKLKAEWKIKRLKLNEKRINFLAQDKINLNEQVLKFKCAAQYGSSNGNSENEQLYCTPMGSNLCSVASSSSWLTCPSHSYESCLASKTKFDVEFNPSLIVNNEVEYKNKRIPSIKILNSSFRNNSFSDLQVQDNFRDKVTLLKKKSSSDTNIAIKKNINYENTSDVLGETICNNNLNIQTNVNNINSLLRNAPGLEIDTSCKSSTINVYDSNIYKFPKQFVVMNINNVDNMHNQPMLLSNSEKLDNDNTERDIEGNMKDINSLNQITPAKSVSDECHEEDQMEVLVTENNVITCSAKKAAFLNKLKMFKSEYGIFDYNLNNDTCNKNKVLEIKIKTNENMVKERTQELAVAGSSNFVESRKEAARNKAKVMSSECCFLPSNMQQKQTSDQHINKIIQCKSLDDMSSNIFISPDLNQNNESKVFEEEKNLENKEITKPSCSLFRSSLVDSKGHLILNEKPLVVDIAGNCLSNKSFISAEIDSSNVSIIHYCLYKSIAIPTEIQKRFTNQAILRLFISNESLMDHLKCIRNYFFLLDGEYGRTLTRNLFNDLENTEQPSTFLTYYHLNSILRLGIASIANESKCVERLSFFVKETPLTFILTNPEVLNCLCMRYCVNWPLNVVLTDEAIYNYDIIFTFQLKLQRASWALEQDMQLLKLKNMLRSSHYRKVQIFRHTMTHFVRAISNYIIKIALEESWVEFQNNFKNVDSLDSLYTAHVDYIKMTLFRCLLNKRSHQIHKTIMELLRNILTFHELLRTGEWVYDMESGNHTHSAFPRLFHQYSTFVQVIKYLIKFLNRVICIGYQPHLDVLITFLSGNDFYNK